MKRWTRLALVAAAVLGTGQPVAAQHLRDRIGQLFIFGPGEDPLFLSGSADPDNPASVQAHGKHFIPAAQSSNGTIIDFLTGAIGTNITNLPINATNAAVTFSLVGGVPQQTSTSLGPIFAERAQTLGRGRAFLSAAVNSFDFRSLRGVDLDKIHLDFTHQNSDFAGCDSIFGGDCSVYGIPSFENDFISFDLSLHLNVVSTVFVFSYGLLDRLDVGVALPLIRTSLRGVSNAQVVPFGPPADHFFGGTVDNPNLFASRSVDESSTGLGDMALRVKYAVVESGNTRLSLLADARFPTGSAKDLRGSGKFSMRGLGILSSQYGNFALHLNAGYLQRHGDLENDALLATVEFDQALAPWASLAVDFMSQTQVGASKLTFPTTVTIDAPYHRTITPTNIPNIRDNLVDQSIGFKFLTPSGIVLITNAIWPLNQGGLRSGVSFTAGVQYGF